MRNPARNRWLIPAALFVAFFGPVIRYAGPEGGGSPERYVPVGFFVLMLFTPAFPFGAYVLPQYLLYALGMYLMLRICFFVAGGRDSEPRSGKRT